MTCNNKVAVVTGAGRGIGRAVALRLAAAGAKVIAAARTRSELDETTRLAAGRGGSCTARVTDLCSRTDIAALISETAAAHGRLDVLVNNAGVAPLSPMAQLSDADFDLLVATNITAVFAACRAAWPHLLASRGTIINISSMASIDPFPGFAAYGASKAWVNLFTRALGDEGRPHGVRAFAVGPGAVETPLLRGSFPGLPAEQCLDPDEVAGLIELLLDERTRHATGQTIFIHR